MQKIICGTVVFSLLCLLLTVQPGCKNLSKPGGKLPSNWPVAELTMPEGASFSVEHQTDPQLGEFWYVTINYDGGWDAMVGHIEGCAGKLGYRDFWTEKPGEGDSRDKMRDYISPDGYTQLLLMNQSNSKTAKNDYKLTVSQTTQPPMELSKGGTTSPTGVKYHLDPIETEDD